MHLPLALLAALPLLTPSAAGSVPSVPVSAPVSAPLSGPATLPTTLPTAAALPARVDPIPGIHHEYQRLNNCGPVTLGMAMSRWGSTLGQATIAPALKPTRTDKNVSTEEMAAYARGQGYATFQGNGGSVPLVRRLLAAGFPVIAESWFVTPEEGGMGHFRLLSGYDDASGRLFALDSFYGPHVQLDYGDFTRMWNVYQGRFLVVYPPTRQAQLQAALGDMADRRAMWARVLSQAELAVRHRPDDALARYNLGVAELSVGDSRSAARSFGAAISSAPDRTLDPTRPAYVTGGLPWRMLWYRTEPFEAYLRTGQPDKVLRLAAAVLRDAPDIEEALYWRGRALAQLGRTGEVGAAYRAALRERPGYAAARQALSGLTLTAAK